jgi:pentafunctional AROM polypeptide
MIFFIGMPHSGKSTLGRFIAKKLNYLFVDLDEEIKNEINGLELRLYIDQHGREMFHALELTIFKRILDKFSSLPSNVLISCGGGCVQTLEFREELSRQAYVIYIHRHIDDIKQESLNCKLNLRPMMDLDQKLKDRQAFYRQCSKYEFCLLKNDMNWEQIQTNLLTFIKRIINSKTQLSLSDYSFFICLTYKDLIDTPVDEFTSVIRGSELIELRVDLLKSFDIDFLGQQIAYIRKHTCLPILFTVRSQINYGTFENNEINIFQILNYGIRLGCEFIDMETNWNNSIKTNWIKTIENKHPYIIASLHLKLSLFKFDQVIHQCTNNGPVDLIKIVLDIDNQMTVIEDVLNIFVQLKQAFKQSVGSKLILIAMGEQGKITRVLNRFLTPVTHELLPSPAVKAQLTAKQIQEIRCSLNMIQQKNYYLFGNCIQQSLSPLIHQTGFDYFYLPYKYQLYQTDQIEQIKNIINDVHFGGASVTIPFKEDIYILLISNINNTLTDSAKQIKAVNTINKLPNGYFIGDNTDWMAIYKLTKEKIFSKGPALVIGAGGTARAALYALNQIEHIQLIYLYNPRHPQKSIDLAETYHYQNILPLTNDNINQMENVIIVVNTLPSSVNFTLDNLFFQKTSSSEYPPILFDVNYFPYETTLIKQAQQYNWNIIHGIDMLIEQGLQQFQIWTGKVAAVAPIIEQSVRKTFHRMIDEQN